MPKIKLLDDPAVAELVARREAKVAAATKTNLIRSVRGTIKGRLESIADKSAAVTYKMYMTEIVAALRDGGCQASPE